jgi:crossover junction endodeoxyribonuclease RusA
MTYKIVIPEIPPSNNKYMGNGRMGSNYKYQEEKRMWEWLVRAAVKEKPDKPLKKAIVKITYYFPTKHRRDPDNYSGKFLLDGLTKAGIIEDDSFSNIDLVLVGKIDRDNPRTEIEVVECKI